MNKKLKKKLIKWIWGAALFPFVFLFIMIVLINWGVFGKMPTFEDLENPQSELATEVYAEDGSGNYTLLGRYALKNRSHIEYKELSPHLVKALIATEDVRFVKHSGIDYRSLARVLFKTVLGRNNKYGGGSTITQQLALNLYSERSSNKIKRVIQKLQEWVTAVNLEKNYTKTEILTMYFNTIPFGYESYGIRTAAQTYFSKLPAELNLEESALMTGILNAPSWYNPVRHPERAKDRRNVVLSQMLKYGYIEKKEYDSISKLDIKLAFKLANHNTGYGTYFRETLRQIMKMQRPDIKNYRFKTREEYIADSIQWEKNPLFGWCNKYLINGRPCNIDRDGLKIYTTINAKMQQYAEEAVVEHLSKTLQPQFNTAKKYRKRFPFSNLIKESDVNESISAAIRNSDRYRSMKKAGHSESEIMKSFNDPVQMTVFSWNGKNNEVDTVMTPRDSILYYKSILRVAFMAIEPHTGRIKAYVGGHNFKYFKFDNTRQGRRQIGSTVKPFLYTLALQEGWNPCSKVINNTQTIPLPEGGIWSPKTSEKEEYTYGREITLKMALALSSNNVSAYLIQRIPPHALVDICHRFGLTGYMDPTPAICVGSSDMSLFEMVAAYNVFPSKGMYTYPFFVSHIEDKHGNRLASFVPDKKDVISEETAYTTVNLMQGVTMGGTGTRVRNYVPYTMDVAGKTGTTNNNSDGWFIGYVPKLTAGVWIGNEDRGAYLMGDGARMSLPIWGMFMKKVLADKNIPIRDTDKFEVPPGIDKSMFNCPDDGADRTEQSNNTLYH
ncbi:MAG: transglycosylase domain-containing protein [Prevotellaceae bacterium]|jgi:penicillin-binding protein 1A|nr:transglycosylase domain-containing protein [Prevotellaceae bacterium]